MLGNAEVIEIKPGDGLKVLGNQAPTLRPIGCGSFAKGFNERVRVGNNSALSREKIAKTLAKRTIG
jgi:hypothetical protein